jgi:Secretion system C-terminal sorting domain
LGEGVRQRGNSQTPDFSIFPNPAHTEFTIQSPKEGNGNVTVFDITQKAVLSTKINSKSTTVALASMFSPGIYIVRVTMEDGMSFTDKLIVQ